MLVEEEAGLLKGFNLETSPYELLSVTGTLNFLYTSYVVVSTNRNASAAVEGWKRVGGATWVTFVCEKPTTNFKQFWKFAIFACFARKTVPGQGISPRCWSIGILTTIDLHICTNAFVSTELKVESRKSGLFLETKINTQRKQGL